MVRVFGFWRFPKGVRMTVAEAMGLMFAFGMFILALLTYIDRTRKSNVLTLASERYFFVMY